MMKMRNKAFKQRNANTPPRAHHAHDGKRRLKGSAPAPHHRGPYVGFAK